MVPALDNNKKVAGDGGFTDARAGDWLACHHGRFVSKKQTYVVTTSIFPIDFETTK